ncbi:MAG: outer membrane protein assembly factor BamD [Rhodospirillaceae bacterium]|nr:outer membrane protein assembly factor BamD [Rhodospirillaceae bacterium]
MLPILTRKIRNSLVGVIISALGMATAACSTTNEAPEYVEQTVEVLYNTAVNALEDEQYNIAAERFDEVERQHPYSKWATKSQIMSAYSLYMSNKYDEAILALDRYIQLHPSGKDTAYAYYLKGLTYYEQISDVGRDQEMTERSSSLFAELIKRFPDSEYARDAKIKFELTEDHMAGKEMSVGRYYLERKMYLAAINRFKLVVDRYQTTTHIPEALHRLVEAYLALGVVDEARKFAAVLGHNYASSPWYLDSYAILEDPSVRPADDDTWYKLW